MSELYAALVAALDDQERDALALRGPFRSVTPHATRRITADRRVLARHAPQPCTVWGTPAVLCRYELEQLFQNKTDWPCPDVVDLAARYDVEVDLAIAWTQSDDRT